MRFLAASAAVLVASGLSGCGGRATTVAEQEPPAGDSGTGELHADGTIEAGVEDAGATSSDATPAPDAGDSPDKTGFLYLESRPLGPGGTTGVGFAMAAFGDTPCGQPSETELLFQDGDCALLKSWDVGDPVECPAVTPHAGLITFAGLIEPLTLEPDAYGSYGTYMHQAHSPLWLGGETIGVQAEGGDVPAFSLEVAAPGPLVLLEPEVQADAPLWHPQGQAFELAWKPASGTVYVSTSSHHEPGEPSVAIACWFDGDDGVGTIPASVLSSWGSNGMTLFMMATVDEVVQAGDYEVDLLAIQRPVDESGEAVDDIVVLFE